MDGNSDIQSAFPFSNTGFLKILPNVPITPPATYGPLLVNLE